MFGIVRKKSHSQLARQELNQGVEHFRQAATHAARGTGAAVGPRVNAARDRVQPAAGKVKGAASSGWGSAVAVLAPLAAAATDAAKQADKQSKKAGKQADKAKADAKNAKNVKALQKATGKALGRKQAKQKRGKLAGLLMAGAAVGAGVMVLRRRQQQRWDEYDPSRPIGSTDPVDTESSLPTGLQPNDAAFQPLSSTSPAAYAAEATTTQSTTTPSTTTTSALGGDDLDIADAKVDQTSSPLHSPKVARMAGGSTES